MTMQEKIKADEARLEFNCQIVGKLARLRNRSQILERICNEEVEENGEFAKVFASTMRDHFSEIAKEADKILFIVANSEE